MPGEGVGGVHDLVALDQELIEGIRIPARTGNCATVKLCIKQPHAIYQLTAQCHVGSSPHHSRSSRGNNGVIELTTTKATPKASIHLEQLLGRRLKL